MSTEDLKDFLEEIKVLDELPDKYEALIDLGRQLEPLAEEFKTENNLVGGCQSRVWLIGQYKNGKMFFSGWGEAMIVNGLLAVLLKVFNGLTPLECLEQKLDFIDGTGLKATLTPSRVNGFYNMHEKIKFLATSFNSQNS
jgi:cysteine desulfuration protein SufE